MHTQEPSYNKNLLLSLVILNSFFNPFLAAAVNIALPQIADTFKMNAITMSWVGMTFLLSSAVFLVPMGKVADIVGRKRIFLYGNIILTIGSALCAMSVSASMLLLSRVVQGIGAAMMFGTGMAIVTAAFEPKERGKAIGMIVSVVYLGLSSAPILGGILTHYFGWQSLFWITVPVGVFIVITTIVAIKAEWKEAKHETFDLKGSVIYMVFLSMLMYGFTKLPNLYAIALTVVGILGLVWFVRVELKTKYPVLNIQLFTTNKVFAYSNLAALINYAATFAITFLLSLYLQYVKGMSPRDAGMILITQPLVMTIFASFAGKLSDKYDSRILSSLGMWIIVVGLFLMTFISMETSNHYIIASLIILGVGFGLFSSPNTHSIMDSVERHQLGVASATVSTMRSVGQMMSMGIATLIMHIYIGDSKITESNHIDFLHSVQVAFVLFAVLCALGAFASLVRNK